MAIIILKSDDPRKKVTAPLTGGWTVEDAVNTLREAGLVPVAVRDDEGNETPIPKEEAA
jgi:rhodanese-related sulfurtransferase